MRTAIFVYETVTLNINAAESDLELSGMDIGSVPLAYGDNSRSIARGIYKILSNNAVSVTGNDAAFDIEVAALKENEPTRPLRAVTDFASVDALTLQAFLAAPDAKVLRNP